jgi:upstream activation factor subunit UAF30
MPSVRKTTKPVTNELSTTPVVESSSTVSTPVELPTNNRKRKTTSKPALAPTQQETIVESTFVESVLQEANNLSNDVTTLENEIVAVQSTPSTDEVNNISEHVEFCAKLNQILSIVSALKKDYKNMELRYARELKLAQRQSLKKKKRSGTRTPSGFVKPTRISDELANFLGKETGSEMARTAVTKEINTYIVLHNLKDKTNGRKINPDEKLNELLKLQEGDELTYFNLQRYMSPHFAKSVKAVVPEVVVA